MVELIKAKVKYQSGKVLKTAYGDRVNCVLVAENGQEVKLWGNVGDPLEKLKKGEEVLLVKEEKGFKLVSSELKETQAEPEPDLEPQSNYSESFLREFEEKAKEHAQLYKICFEVVQANFKSLIKTEESVRTIATTLYLQAIK